MNIKKIKQDRWYETSVGIGQALRVGGTFPPSVRFNIVGPLPRGVVHVAPRDVLRELSEEEIAKLQTKDHEA